MAYKRVSPQPVIEGGTGASTLTAHGVLLGEGTSAITPTAVGTNGQVLLGSTAADPGWVTPTAGTGLSGTFNSSTHSYALSTPVSIANGGTNATSMATTDGVVYYDGTSLVTTSAGTSGQVLTSNGAGVAPTYQAAGGSGLLVSSTVLTSTQIKALRATPITLIAAQGSGNAIWLLGIITKFTYGGTNVFVAAAGQTIGVYYVGTAGLQVYTALFNAALTGSSSSYTQVPIVNSGGNATTIFENQAVVAANTVATEITGNAANDNTITINLLYKVVTL